MQDLCVLSVNPFTWPLTGDAGEKLPNAHNVFFLIFCEDFINNNALRCKVKCLCPVDS
jgi:hypothetical protein